MNALARMILAIRRRAGVQADFALGPGWERDQTGQVVPTAQALDQGAYAPAVALQGETVVRRGFQDFQQPDLPIGAPLKGNFWGLIETYDPTDPAPTAVPGQAILFDSKGKVVRTVAMQVPTTAQLGAAAGGGMQRWCLKPAGAGFWAVFALHGATHGYLLISYDQTGAILGTVTVTDPLANGHSVAVIGFACGEDGQLWVGLDDTGAKIALPDVEPPNLGDVQQALPLTLVPHYFIARHTAAGAFVQTYQLPANDEMTIWVIRVAGGPEGWVYYWAPPVMVVGRNLPWIVPDDPDRGVFFLTRLDAPFEHLGNLFASGSHVYWPISAWRLVAEIGSIDPLIPAEHQEIYYRVTVETQVFRLRSDTYGFDSTTILTSPLASDIPPDTTRAALHYSGAIQPTFYTVPRGSFGAGYDGGFLVSADGILDPDTVSIDLVGLHAAGVKADGTVDQSTALGALPSTVAFGPAVMMVGRSLVILAYDGPGAPFGGDGSYFGSSLNFWQHAALWKGSFQGGWGPLGHHLDAADARLLINQTPPPTAAPLATMAFMPDVP